MDVRKFGPEWFSVALGTLAVSIDSLRLSSIFPLYLVTSAFFYLGLLVLLIVTVLWVLRAVADPSVVRQDYFNVARLSFLPVLPLALLVALTVDIDSGNSLIPLPGSVYSLVYYASYVALFLLAVVLGVRVLLHEVDPTSLTYAVLIPPVAVTATSFLGIPLREYFLSAISIGVGLMLFVFLGSAVVSVHIRESRNPARLTSSVLPVGVSSIIALTLLGVSQGGLISEALAFFTALVLVGFETWNFFVSIVTVALSFRKVKQQPLLLWALTFPVSTYSSASVELFSRYHQMLLLVLSLVAYFTLIAMWVIATLLTLRSLVINGKRK